MRLLLDTHLLIWVAGDDHKLSSEARALIENRENELLFSAVSIWEIAIKHALDKPGFFFEPNLVRQGCRNNGLKELAMTSDHGLIVATLPLIHGDPFDRILVAQAMFDGAALLTADKTIARYPGPIRLV